MTRATLDGTGTALRTVRQAAGRRYERAPNRGASGAVGLEPGDVDSIDGFGGRSATNACDRTSDGRGNPPFGNRVEPSDAVRCSLVPNPRFDNRVPLATSRGSIERDGEPLPARPRSVGAAGGDAVGTTPHPFGRSVTGDPDPRGPDFGAGEGVGAGR